MDVLFSNTGDEYKNMHRWADCFRWQENHCGWYSFLCIMTPPWLLVDSGFRLSILDANSELCLQVYEYIYWSKNEYCLLTDPPTDTNAVRSNHSTSFCLFALLRRTSTRRLALNPVHIAQALGYMRQTFGLGSGYDDGENVVSGMSRCCRREIRGCALNKRMGQIT